MRPKLRPSQIFSRPRQNRDRDVPKQSLETETSRPRLHACSQQHLTSWHAPPIWNLCTLLFGSVAHCSCEYHAAHSDLYPFTSNLVHELHMMWAALLSVVLSVYYFGVLELWVGRANMTKMSEDPVTRRHRNWVQCMIQPSLKRVLSNQLLHEVYCKTLWF